MTDTTPTVGRLEAELIKARAETGTLRAAHQEILNKYARIMKEPPPQIGFG